MANRHMRRSVYWKAGETVEIICLHSGLRLFHIGRKAKNFLIGSYGREQQSDEYSDQIKAKQEEMVALIAENAKVGDYTQEFDEQYRKIAEEISTLKEEQAESARKKKLAENYEQRVKDMDAFISASTCQIPEFDNDLVRRLIAVIRVISADRIEIQFQSGIVMEQEIDYE